MELTRKYRSPLAQVKHLGSAKHGTTHWLLQRITALMIIPLGVWFFLNLLNHMRSDYDTVMAWFTSPLNLIGNLVFFITALFHAVLGIQVVIEDYIHQQGIRFALLWTLKVGAVISGAVAIAVMVWLFMDQLLHPTQLD
ncbi:succinate dehydrogenase, hydrophobic membrane anchor protein [Candidatus Nucleicultrix amoebiphila]|jgi:succinate dehydrogenase / fumarate reductase membrane anchor subunit|uniref:succinate dehydrogenase, hydrophobic membrane anchor protein n=1 Tax=Candidatus Nucleicultrix amoebiphila TaxID=1509244 RepID=UPI000A26DE63|nr:succinate dehydrogenase, hydrophobic membrane anchor protein [Candidatus Nucleicultrix amoebiphila]